jgi:hypothetical protein
MLNVSILRGATVVGASQDSLEMDTTVQLQLWVQVRIYRRWIQLYKYARKRVRKQYYYYHYTDIDECAGNSTCDDNADCDDSDGSYWCQCLPGFQGDGYNCRGNCAKEDTLLC